MRNTILLSLIIALLVFPIITANAENTYSIDFQASSSQYLRGGDESAYDITSDMTIEAWIKPESLPNSNGMVIVDRYYDGSKRAWQFMVADEWSGSNANTLVAYVGNAAGSGATVHTADANKITSGSWQHVAMVFDDSEDEIEFFVNGVSAGTSTKTDAIGTNDEPLCIGRSDYNTQRYFDGLIDDVRIWSEARTQAQLQANDDTELVGNETNLVGYWKFNNDATDETAQSNDLTLYNSPVYSEDVPFEDTGDPPAPATSAPNTSQIIWFE